MRKTTDPHSCIVENVNLYNINLQARELYLVGEENVESEDGYEPGVEYVMSNRLIKNIRLLDTTSHDPILIHMKSCGGDWCEGMAIYDTIRFCKSPVTILSYTHAESMSSIILQAADHRVLMPNSYFMYHHGSLEVHGEWVATMSFVEWERRIPNIMIDIYAGKMVESKHSKYYKDNIDEVRKMLAEHMRDKVDCFFSSEEAVNAGLADAVFDGDWDNLKDFTQ